MSEVSFENLRELLLGKSFVILGVGNRLRGDDGVGAELAEELSGLPGGERVWETGTVPENYLGRIVKIGPDVIIILDSVDFGQRPGKLEGFGLSDLSGGMICSHSFSLAGMREWFDQLGLGKTVVIGIQPKSLELGSGLSREVSEAKDFLKDILRKILQGKQETRLL